ncbi:uncharacterized protein LOC122513008 [Leptopilina heterotoma]|uniref:uncharacterized protein LOC122513008 n=1 Tax=Leptopilina heterotoma TaxID=63436 RepID=UPI001CA8B98A|nr:uncharacterized protein LOC122513008 [Leptopilina heterotoma]
MIRHTPLSKPRQEKGDEVPQETASLPDVRRSGRINKGIGPPRYDELLQSRLTNITEYRVTTPQIIENRPPSVISRNSVSSNARASRQLEIELRRQEELAELDHQKAERDRQIIDLRARLEEAKMFEDEQRRCPSKASYASVRSMTTINSQHLKVVDWLQKGNASDDKNKRRDSENRKIDLDSMGKFRAPPVNNAYMARQALGKDLPEFKGSTSDWILFEKMFYQTTEACGFSPAENMLRLQKCLKGDALESVRALLMTTNVDRVIIVLRRRFGRAEHIIEDIVHKVTSAPSVKEDRPITMIRFAEGVTNLVATIESLNQPSYLTNPLLVKQLVSKLPASERMAWGKKTAKNQDGTCLREFSEWIEEEADAASAIYQPERDRNEKCVMTCRDADQVKSVDNGKCLYCDRKSHPTDACYSFLKLAVDDRWKWVRKKRVCFRCLGTNHNIRECKAQGCTQPGCTHRHHTLLHNDFLESRQRTTKSDGKSTSTTENNENNIERVTFTNKDARRVYLRILPVTLRGPDREIDTYALLDGGSTVSLISEEMADKLGLRGPRRPLIASWYDNTTNEDHASREVNLEIRGINGKTFNIRDARTTKMNMPGQSMTVNSKKWPYLRDIDIPDLNEAVPTIMIGEDNLHLKKVIRQVAGKQGTPFATLTPLGWMVHGPDFAERPERDVALLVRHKNEECELNELVRDFWTTESFRVTPSCRNVSSNEDKRAREVLKRTMKRVGDRWEVGLLWKVDQEVLPESYENAKKRLISINKKMASDPEFGKRYSANIQAYITKGYARKVTDEESKQRSDRIWYLPHFAAYNPQKPDKLRMVLDAASKSHGLSLNDRLLKGPDLLKPLPGVLFRFREKRIAICGDLREMFHQVRIRKEDQPSQRILWRDDTTKEIQTLEMTVMIFGAISSPYVAHEVRNHNAEEFRDLYPEAYDAIVNNHYVDDFLDSADTIDDATRKVRKVMYVHKRGGFELRNIMTNSSEVRASLNAEFLAPTNEKLTIFGENYTRVLGVNWTPEIDCFFFSTEFLKSTEEVTRDTKGLTKRTLLKMLMSLFDPLGLLAPLTIRGKIILQDIWREGTKWDEEVTEDTAKSWATWIEDLQQAEHLRIPRHYAGLIDRLQNVQLHVFCDASIQAFAAVAYLRLQEEDKVQTALVMAKTRVAPIKLLTVPRLELQSAVMATRLAEFIQQEHNIVFDKTIFWPDSQTALGWIQSDARKYQPFVAHRIAEILDKSSPTDWRWVPTELNVADDATRSKKQETLHNTSRWFQGPEFLRQPESEWPQPKTLDRQSAEITGEMKKEHCFITHVEVPIIDSSCFSSWLRITRVAAWMLRFIDRCRKRPLSTSSSELTGLEMRRAEHYVIR